jgi:hypothetical protein
MLDLRGERLKSGQEVQRLRKAVLIRRYLEGGSGYGPISVTCFFAGLLPIFCCKNCTVFVHGFFFSFAPDEPNNALLGKKGLKHRNPLFQLKAGALRNYFAYIPHAYSENKSLGIDETDLSSYWVRDRCHPGVR